MRAFQNSTVQLVQHRAAGPSLSPPGTTNIACQGHAIDHCHRAAQHRTALAAGPSPRCLEHVASIRRAASAICCETTTQGVAWGKNRVRVRRGQPIKAASADGSERGSQRLPGADRSSLQKTTALVETAMLAAVSGLAYLVATILKVENSIGYFLPLPVVLAAMRSGVAAGWKTMGATAFLLVVLLGPLRAISYLLLHGVVAATLGALWSSRTGWWMSIGVSALVRLGGQLSYLLLSSFTMNENFFWVVLNNVYSMLDQIAAAVGMAGSPSTTAVTCMLFSLLLVNSIIYCFLLHVVFRLILQSMGFQLGPLPGIVRKYLYAGMSPEAQQQLERQAQDAARAQAEAREARAQ